MGVDFCEVLQKTFFWTFSIKFIDIKLSEVWKTLHKSDFPIQLEKRWMEEDLQEH